eukprot:ANDGO_07627.mRNA.1 hypothetical protein
MSGKPGGIQVRASSIRSVALSWLKSSEKSETVGTSEDTFDESAYLRGALHRGEGRAGLGFGSASSNTNAEKAKRDLSEKNKNSVQSQLIRRADRLNQRNDPNGVAKTARPTMYNSSRPAQFQRLREGPAKHASPEFDDGDDSDDGEVKSKMIGAKKKKVA